MPKHAIGLTIVILVCHAALLAWGAWRHSPTFNEVGHLPAGLSHLAMGRFELYRANPPLVRYVAAVPVALVKPSTDWSRFDNQPLSNSVNWVAVDFVQANGYRSFWLYSLARWACIPFSLLGGWLCFRMAAEMYGVRPGLLAVTLWCFSPDILGHGATIMPDVPAAALGLAACYSFRRWLVEPAWHWAVVAGIVLGFAELTKFTLLVLYPLWIVLWVVCRSPRRGRNRESRLSLEAGMLSLAFVLSLVVINGGYGYEGSFQHLGEFQFQSRVLTGVAGSTSAGRQETNRFRNSWAGSVPVPLPRNYVQGIDKQKSDFEQGMRSYVGGNWKDRGCGYFYLYALALKLPLGTWPLLGMALWATMSSRNYLCPWRHELLLILPALTILALVSSQTGFSVHTRYVYPAFPFMFVWISKVAGAFQVRQRLATVVILVSFLWSVVSTLSVYPHSISYFNELCGGPVRGADHLLDSSIAWGQDLLLARDWYDSHPEARPFHLVSFGWVDPRVAGIEFRLPPIGPSMANTHCTLPPERAGPQPGWHAVDANYLYGADRHVHDGRGGLFWPAPEGCNFEYFRLFQPVARAGYSICIYHITLKEANRVRHELGLPELVGE